MEAICCPILHLSLVAQHGRLRGQQAPNMAATPNMAAARPLSCICVGVEDSKAEPC